MIGDFETSVSQSPTLLYSIAKGMKGSCGIDEDNEEANREAASNASRMFSSAQILSDSPATSKAFPHLLEFAAKGLLLESNRESSKIYGNSLILLQSLSRLDDFKVGPFFFFFKPLLLKYFILTMKFVYYSFFGTEKKIRLPSKRKIRTLRKLSKAF